MRAHLTNFSCYTEKPTLSKTNLFLFNAAKNRRNKATSIEIRFGFCHTGVDMGFLLIPLYPWWFSLRQSMVLELWISQHHGIVVRILSGQSQFLL
jgi:hypothetical protein